MVTGKFGPAALSESLALRSGVRGRRIKALRLAVTVRDVAGKKTVLTAQIKHLR